MNPTVTRFITPPSASTRPIPASGAARRKTTLDADGDEPAAVYY